MNLTNFFKLFKEKIALKIASISEQRHLQAIRQGLISTIPFSIIGSLCFILRFPPINQTSISKQQNWLITFLVKWKLWAKANEDLILQPFYISIGLIGLFAVIGISYNLAKRYNLDPLSSVGLTIMSYLIISAPINRQQLTITYLDAKGLFTAIIVAISTVELIRIIKEKNWNIKLPQEVPPAIMESFASLLPGIILIILFSAINLLTTNLTGMIPPQAIMEALTPTFEVVDSPWGVLVYGILSQLLWFTGIHGTTIMNTAFRPFLERNWMINATLHLQERDLSNIFTMPFVNFYLMIGGSGATLALAFLYLTSRSKQLKNIGKIGLIPVIFNINEIIIFGSPIVLNPIMLIPFVFIPPIIGLIAYFTTKWGWVGEAFTKVPWTTPAPIGAFLSTLDWRSVILTISLILISGVLYYPFFKIYEEQLINQEETTDNCDQKEVNT